MFCASFEITVLFQQIPVSVTVVGDRKILPNPRANQIPEVSGYFPFMNREKKLAVFKISVCFCKNQLGIQLPTAKSRVAHRVRLGVSLHIGLRAGVDVRTTDGSDVIN